MSDATSLLCTAEVPTWNGHEISGTRPCGDTPMPGRDVCEAHARALARMASERAEIAAAQSQEAPEWR